VQGAAVNLDVGDRLEVRPPRSGVRVQADVGSHAPQQLDETGTRRVHADAGERERTIGREAPRHQEKRGRGKIRRHR